MVSTKDNVDVFVRATTWRWPLYLMDISFERVGEIEQNNDSSLSEVDEKKHIAYTTGAIVSSVSLLESIINTTIFDIVQGTPAKARYDIDVPEVKKKIDSEYESIYNYEDENETLIYQDTLNKYNEILRFSGSEQFETGQGLHQEITFVIKLRNHLVHPKPENVTVQDETGRRKTFGEHQSLEGSLKGKYSKNPFSDTPVFEYLSYDCVRWASKSTIEFIDEFYSRLGAEPVYEETIKDLQINNLRG